MPLRLEYRNFQKFPDSFSTEYSVKKLEMKNTNEEIRETRDAGKYSCRGA